MEFYKKLKAKQRLLQNELDSLDNDLGILPAEISINGHTFDLASLDPDDYISCISCINSRIQAAKYLGLGNHVKELTQKRANCKAVYKIMTKYTEVAILEQDLSDKIEEVYNLLCNEDKIALIKEDYNESNQK